MSNAPQQTPSSGSPSGARSAPESARPSASVQPRTAPRVDFLPPYRVLLHNDQHNDMLHVVESLVDLTCLDLQRATNVMLEAHTTGVALVLVTHRERAELYVEQFRSKGLTVTIEPAE